MSSSRIRMFISPLVYEPSCTHDTTGPLVTGAEQDYTETDVSEEVDDGEVRNR